MIPTPVAALDDALDRFRGIGPIDATPGVVAFSGGPDSTALLLALVRRRRRRGGPRLLAAHLDHAADAGSRERARRAARLARRLGVAFVEHRLSPAALDTPGESREAAARRHRYRFLARVAADAGAGWIATAHHRDDQAETVLLRLAFGSGLGGLAGVGPVVRLPRSVRAAVRRREAERLLLLRPLLALPRDTLAAALEHPELGSPARPAPDEGRPGSFATAREIPPAPPLRPATDPTNRDLAVPRNRIRHRVLPALEEEARESGEPPLAPRLARLAARAQRARRVVDRKLAIHLRLRPAGGAGGPEAAPGPAAATGPAAVATGTAAPPAEGAAPAAATDPRRPGQAPPAVDRGRLASLPEPLLPAALALLHRAAGAGYPPGREARRELQRQLAAGAGVGCDCGDGLRWEARGSDLVLVPAREESPQGGFSYILVVPGEVEIHELGLRLQLDRAPVAPWMFRGSPHRAGLELALTEGDVVTVRNRRPGDRIHPLGATGSRRLKEVLVDHRVPRHERDRIPLLCVGGKIAWVPGVTVAEAFRLPAEPPAGAIFWVASLRPAETSEP